MSGNLPQASIIADKDNVGLLVSNHTLASSIISRHNTSDPVLDANEFTMLKAFCNNPSQKDEILTKFDMSRDRALASESADQKGSLVAFIMAKHGTSNPILTGAELQALKGWFEKEDLGI